MLHSFVHVMFSAYQSTSLDFCNTFSLGDYLLHHQMCVCLWNTDRDRWRKRIYRSFCAEIPCKNDNNIWTMTESFATKKKTKKQKWYINGKKGLRCDILSLSIFFDGNLAKQKFHCFARFQSPNTSIGSTWFVNWLHLFHYYCAPFPNRANVLALFLRRSLVGLDEM